MSQKNINHGRIISMPDGTQCLDTVQLNTLEQSFRQWAEDTTQSKVRLSRRRILLIFLLIRYTGAKLNEVLELNPFKDIDYDRHLVVYHDTDSDDNVNSRKSPLSKVLSNEIQSILADPFFNDSLENVLYVDPGFVRRKFYERAQACDFPKQLGGPEMIRKSRAVELMQSNIPLPAVQMLLGHSTPNLTSSYVSFSEDEILQVTKHFMEKESSRKTSARNSFFGKIKALQKGDIQTRVELTTMSGLSVTTVITNDSVDRLGLKKGKLVTADVKAPWVILQRSDSDLSCTAENRFNGVIERVNKGGITTEYVIHLSDGTEMCSIVTTESSRHLDLKVGDNIWTLFNSYSVVLRMD
jgi:molybdate transport system regulatory protein